MKEVLQIVGHTILGACIAAVLTPVFLAIIVAMAALSIAAIPVVAVIELHRLGKEACGQRESVEGGV